MWKLQCCLPIGNLKSTGQQDARKALVMGNYCVHIREVFCHTCIKAFRDFKGDFEEAFLTRGYNNMEGSY